MCQLISPQNVSDTPVLGNLPYFKFFPFVMKKHPWGEYVARQYLAKVFLNNRELIQSNFNGSNNFGTMKMCSRQGEFELMSVNHNARTGGKIKISFHFSLT